MTDDKQELADGSDALLEALVLLRETQRRMKAEHVASARFRELAHDAHQVTDDIMWLVREQDELGDRIPTGEDTIEDVIRETPAS